MKDQLVKFSTKLTCPECPKNIKINITLKFCIEEDNLFLEIETVDINKVWQHYEKKHMEVNL